MEVIKNISIALGAVLSSITLTRLILQGPKKFFSNWLKKTKRTTVQSAESDIMKKLDEKFFKIEEQLSIIAEDNSKQVEIFDRELEHTNFLLAKSIESQQQVLRSNLTNLYDKAMKKGYLTCYEKKNMIMEYNIYSDVLGGNSFVQTIVNELMKMPVKEEKTEEK